jgi:hypothetical protein
MQERIQKEHTTQKSQSVLQVAITAEMQKCHTAFAHLAVIMQDA